MRASPAVTGRSTFEDDDGDSNEDTVQGKLPLKEVSPSIVQKGNAIKKRPVQMDEVDSEEEEDDRQPYNPPAKRGRPLSAITKKVAAFSDFESSLGADIAIVKY